LLFKPIQDMGSVKKLQTIPGGKDNYSSNSRSGRINQRELYLLWVGI